MRQQIFVGLAILLVSAKAALDPSQTRVFSCVERPDGNYEHPEFPCSHYFVSCSGGITSLRGCSADTRYDSLSDNCLEPQYVVACNGTATTPAPTETEPPTEEPGVVFDCSQQDDGDFANPQEPCSRLFITCASGSAVLKVCPSSLFFDTATSSCQHPRLVEACGGSTTVASEPTEPPTTTAPAIDFDCTLEEDGEYENPDEPCSNMYVTCTGGSTIVSNCPESLFFDKDQKACDLGEFIVSCGGSPKTTTEATTTTTAEGQTTTTTPEGVSCAGREIGNFGDPAGPCSQKFYTCIGVPKAIEQLCQAGTFYDSELDQCAFFNDNPECTNTPRPTTTTANVTTTTTTRAPTTSPEFDCAIVGPGNHADPRAECSTSFVICTVDNRAFHQECPLGLYYDKEFNQCLYFSDVPECSGTPRPTEPTETEAPEEETTAAEPATTTTPVPFDCSAKGDGNYEAPDTACAKFFFQCVGGRANKAHCPGNLRYSRRVDACLAAKDVPGCPGFVSSPCDGLPNGFYADPADCTKFYFCVDRYHFSLNCPKETVFSSQHGRCMPKKDVSPPCGFAQPPKKFTCSGLTDGLYPDNEDCNVFHQCDGGEQKLFTCQQGFAFNPATEECETAAAVPGCAPKTVETLFDFCELQERDGIYTYPGNCHRSVVCVHGFPFVFICDLPHRPDFNPLTKSCEANVPGCEE